MRKWKKMASLLCALAMMGSILSVNAWAVPSGIAVQVNGQEIALTDVAPEAQNGRTFIPVRAVFEALGAEVTWDQENQSAVAVKEDTTVVMTLGSTTAQVTKDGETTDLTMDVAPYAKNGRTYVPVRFAAQAFSCAVGWDSAARTVVIVDVPALFGDATFGNLNRWMQASMEEEVPNPARTAGTANLTLTVSDESGASRTYPLDMTFEGFSTDEQVQMMLEMDFSDFMELLVGSELSTAEKQELLRMSNAFMEVRMDAATGKVYFTIDSELLRYLTGDSMGNGDLWYLMDLGQLMAATGMDYETYMQSLMAAETEYTDFKSLMVSMLSGMELTSADMDYEMLVMMAQAYCNLFSDQAMVRNGSDYAASWAIDGENGSAGAQIDLTYQTQGNQLTGMTMEVSATSAGETISVLSMDVYSDGTDTELTLDCNFGSAMQIHFDLNAETVATAVQPEIEPPAGSEVVDLLGGLDQAEAAA